MLKYLFPNFLLALTFFGVVGVACTPQKNTAYFQTVPYNSEIQTLVTKDFEHKIKVDDVLLIGIFSPSERITLYNTSPEGYLVDKSGNIQLYNVGNVKVGGLTIEEAKNKIQKLLEPDYLKNVSVSARFKNHKIVVLGEVGSPGIIPMETEHLSILDAIAASGDLRETARKDNLLVIRNTDRGKLFFRVNLLDGSVFNSNFYYLQAEDILYVEPEQKKKSANVDRILSYVLSGISLVLLLSDRLK
jgi:polysaccharide export outer membrane protein